MLTRKLTGTNDFQPKLTYNSPARGGPSDRIRLSHAMDSPRTRPESCGDTVLVNAAVVEISSRKKPAATGILARTSREILLTHA